MPSAELVLAGLAALANDWKGLAIAWHLALAAVLLASIGHGRLSSRRLGYLLVLPLASVSALAWTAGNPFNGTTFALFAVGVAVAARTLPVDPVAIDATAWAAAGAGFVAFGWVYPHFLQTDWIAYAYAAPFGILPCPTLSVLIGMTLLFASLRTTPWTAWLLVAGTMYGLVGVFRLGVRLDYGLLVGVVALTARTSIDRRRSSRAALAWTEGERVISAGSVPRAQGSHR